ncbi:MAG: peptidoglycan DD-metalloendopeptidase family protein [Gammaproteobacteria bacterium]|nr:peptidoglycan DD-metalloendopeptidase family protein [Gammaproteobacteria bacterium]
MSQSTVNPGTFPRPHLIIASVLALLMFVVGVKQFSGAEADRFTSEAVLLDMANLSTASASVPAEPAGELSRPAPRHTASITPLALPGSRQEQPADPAAATATATSALLTLTDPSTLAPGPAAPVRPVKTDVTSVEVRPGDNLSVIFKRQGLPARDIHNLLASEPHGKRLKNIFPGHSLTFTRDDDGTLLKLAYTPGPLETLEFDRIGNRFQGRETFQEPTRTTSYKHGVIQHSLFIASQRAGLPDRVTMRLAQIFQWDVDFVLDIRRDDEFHVIYEELYIGDEFIGFGDILAAEFVNRGERYRAIRYTDAQGRADYYNPSGESMRKAFLRAPVEFSRISSNFNLRRVHPLFKRNIPHRGIDYAAPTGTPILAAGDGRIVTASRTEPNGNYVVIQHGEQFTTKYLHLSKFARGIRGGARVKQGQTIGYVGSTGWATGPHLHYEFLVNGVHQNPRTVQLPDAEPIPTPELARFNQSAEPLLTMLEDYKQQVQLAYGR